MISYEFIFYSHSDMVVPHLEVFKDNQNFKYSVQLLDHSFGFEGTEQMSPEVRTEEWKLLKCDKNTRNVGKRYFNLHFKICICYTRKSLEATKSFNWLLNLLQIKLVLCFIFVSHCCHR